MNTAVVYYSLEGNSRVAAQQLADRLGAEVFEVRTTKPYPRKGLAKFLVGGAAATFNRAPQIEQIDMDPSSYDLVVLVLPVWADRAAPPINSFIESRSFDGTKVALVLASASGNADKCADDLYKKLGCTAANTPMLSLKNPGKMDEAELGAQVDGFAERLLEPAGGAF